jgi:hypothetical protein
MSIGHVTMSNEGERLCKVMVVTLFKVLYQELARWTEKIHEKPQDCLCPSRDSKPEANLYSFVFHSLCKKG